MSQHRSFIAAAALLALCGWAAAQSVPPLATLPPPPVPKDNPNTPEKIELGKKLFWEARLSGNGSMPCVSCHLPNLGWGDGGHLARLPRHQALAQLADRAELRLLQQAVLGRSVTSLEAQAPAAAEGAWPATVMTR
jgi:cytochrome c peroxidase